MLQVLVVGNMMTGEGRKKLETVEQVVLSNPTVRSIIPLRQGLYNMFVSANPDYDWASHFFEYFVSSIENADRVVFLNHKSDVQLSKGWIYGYCFSLGIPIVIIQEDNNPEVNTDIFTSHSILAALGDVKELSTYDFREMNTVYT
ncbi:hypothetical protein ABE042_08000 [Viridibacillus arvi]|uniref:hypothetical protein n=1 Tax=Viridibacillus arvi TaxID=263475 RepID=UPI003D2AEF1F